MINNWIIRRTDDELTNTTKTLAEELKISPILARLLAERGIQTYEQAKQFFRPSLTDLHDPFLMTDMRKAVDRLTLAMQRNEKILVYGDYDVDGTTAVTLVYKFLKQFYVNLGYYIPNRYTEGYGISVAGIDYAANNDYTLVIALDCGIKAVGKVAYAKSKGIDFIICDHHTPGDQLPPAVAVLDPKRQDCDYPYDELSGCGVGFKLMQAFARSNDIDESRQLYPLLDLLAMSIASDIVPITGENRILAYYGLRQINQNPSTGVKSLLDVCGIMGQEVTINDLVFKIGPRINASGRMKSASEAVQLLISNDPDFAHRKSGEINEYNNNRKDLDKRITDEALNMIRANAETYRQRSSVVVYNPEWHKGVIGIVASRLSEEFFKPIVVLTKSNGLASGSARSVAGFDIYAAIDSCSDLLETFGGHMYAAGLSLREENVPEFIERFERFVARNIRPEQQTPQIEVDAELAFSDITPRFYRILKQFGPFGPGNPRPVFVTRHVHDRGTSRLVGREQEHLKLDLYDHTTQVNMNGIAFRQAPFYKPLKEGVPLDVCYTIEENNFRGNTMLQLSVLDLKKSNLP